MASLSCLRVTVSLAVQQMLQVLPLALLCEHPILGSEVSASKKSSGNAVTFAVLSFAKANTKMSERPFARWLDGHKALADEVSF